MTRVVGAPSVRRNCALFTRLAKLSLTMHAMYTYAVLNLNWIHPCLLQLHAQSTPEPWPCDAARSRRAPCSDDDMQTSRPWTMRWEGGVCSLGQFQTGGGVNRYHWTATARSLKWNTPTTTSTMNQCDNALLRRYPAVPCRAFGRKWFRRHSRGRTVSVSTAGTMRYCFQCQIVWRRTTGLNNPVWCRRGTWWPLEREA